MSHPALLALRVLLVVIALGTLSIQIVLLPELVREVSVDAPEALRLAVPYAFAAGAAIVCVQIALVALWVLLAKVRRDAIFSPSAFRWVDVIIWAAAVATVITLGVAIWQFGVERLGPPGLVLMLGSAVIGGAAFVLLMIVMRGLLRQATALESELAEVV